MTMNENSLDTRPVNRWRWVIWSGAACLWLLPFVAMQFTREVAWGPFDFVVFGVMLSSVCGAYELITRLSTSTAYRAAFAIALITGFVLIWMNLAVGIIGAEDNPANLMFAGVLLIGVIGAIIARFQARGMSYTLAAMAGAQALIAIVVSLTSLDAPLLPFFGLTGVFAALWLASAYLFHRAAN